MKKFLLALTMTLCILLTFSVASADDMVDACPNCGNTDIKWFPLYQSDNINIHHQFCFTCYSIIGGYEKCIPLEGSATCITPPRCAICNDHLNKSHQPDPNNHAWSQAKYVWDEDYNYCTVSRYCQNGCETRQSEVTTSTLISSTPSTCYEYGENVYSASFKAEWASTQTEKMTLPLAACIEVIDEGIPATCTKTGLTDGSHCFLCNTTLTRQTVIPAKGHKYQTVTTEPTCTKEGKITRTCTVCKYSYVREILPATLHWFDLWTPNANGTHSAPCKHSGCNHIGKASCTAFEVTASDDETILTVCPVCGEFGERVFEVIEQANMKSATKVKLPTGEAIIRSTEAPFEGVLYAFTAAYEYSGEVIPFGTKVTISLPLSAEQFADFELVRVDVTPASETTEIRTPVSFTHENDMLTLEADAAALYLLLPR